MSDKQFILISNDVEDDPIVHASSTDFFWWAAVAVGLIIGLLIGLVAYEKHVSASYMARLKEKENEIIVLESEKDELSTTIATLEEKNKFLSSTIVTKVENEAELTEIIESASTPTDFPLTSAASIEEVTEGDPMCIFTAASGSMVISTASGIVTNVLDDDEFGHSVWIDHGNGLVTIYRNKGDVLVKVGDEVSKGTTLYIVGNNNTKLGYQMRQDDAYIDPMELLSISG